MTLNPSTMRLGIASILVGLVGAYLVREMLPGEEPQEEAKELDTSAVPFASADLLAGRIIKRGDIIFKQMDADQLKEDAKAQGYKMEEVMMEEEFIIGREVKEDISALEPFLTSKVHLEGKLPPLPLQPGKSAVPIPIPEESGRPDRGSFVDVLFTTTPAPAQNGLLAIPEKTIPVAQRARVLDVDVREMSALQYAVGYNSKAPIVTLEVDPQIARNIFALRNHGQFSLIARPEKDVPGMGMGSEAVDLMELLGIEPPPPQPQPRYLTQEIWRRGNRQVKPWPLPPLPPQQPQNQVASQQPATIPPPPPASNVPDVVPDTTPAASYQPPNNTSTYNSNTYRPDSSPRGGQPPASAAGGNNASVGTSATLDTSDPFTDDVQP